MILRSLHGAVALLARGSHGMVISNLHLLNVEIEQFRSIEDQGIPAEGLVVLFGPNSAGKTSVLEAVEDLITRAGTLRSDPGADDDTTVLGSVTFALPAAGIAGSGDARMYRSLLGGEHSKPSMLGDSGDPWAWLEDGLTERLKDAGLDQARSMLAEAFARTGDTGSFEDREVLARSVFDPHAVYFCADLPDISLVVNGPSLPAEAMDAARRIAAIAGDDALWKVATGLVSEGRAHVASIGVEDGQRQSFAAYFPPVIVLDGDLESLSAELESAIIAVHDRLWHIKLETKPAPDEIQSPTLPELSIVVAFDEYQIGALRQTNRYTADPWLETLSEQGEVSSPPAGWPVLYDKGDWYRVRHSVRAAAKLLAIEANRVAPGFVQGQGTIGIEVLPVAVWGSGKHRVRATFTEINGEKRDLRVVGAGTGRWAAAAIRLASRRLAGGSQVVEDDTGTRVDNENERRRLVREAYHAPFTQTAVRVAPSDSPAVYIADEPEAHLHPAALHSVRDWLTKLAETAATVLVATHSTALLDSTSELINRVHVLPGEEGTQLRPMTGALGAELARVSGHMGLTEGELLLMTRLALFVEGPHDQIILDEWFGDDLRGAGIRVFPVHGVDHLPGLVDSEIIAALGIRIATLSDDTSVSRAATGKPRTRGDSAVGRLLAEATRAGKEVHPVGLRQPDILYYLDATICRQVSPTFPGWHAAADERLNAGTHMPWKKWVASQYDLPLSREGIRRLARLSRQQHKIPTELAQQVHALIAYAATTN